MIVCYRRVVAHQHWASSRTPIVPIWAVSHNPTYREEPEAAAASPLPSVSEVILVPTRVTPLVFDKLRNLDQTFFGDPVSLFEHKRVIGGLKLNERPPPHRLRVDICLQDRRVGMDLNPAGEPAEVCWLSGSPRVMGEVALSNPVRSAK